jgi:hypothetical protein
MTCETCNRKTRSDPATYAFAFVAAIWILLNLIASAYVVTHADSAGVRQFLERVNTADAPLLPNNVD